VVTFAAIMMIAVKKIPPQISGRAEAPEVSPSVPTDVPDAPGIITERQAEVITAFPNDRAEIARKKPGILVIIDKSSHTMEVFNDGKSLKRYGIAVGRNSGDKQRVGDMRTPEGEFPIVQIQNASGWTHDFRDGMGQVKGAYGPYFIRLGTPGWTGIGIHGTHAPGSIGTNVTEGCIRLNNRDVEELRRMVKVGDKVVIRR